MHIIELDECNMECREFEKKVEKNSVGFMLSFICCFTIIESFVGVMVGEAGVCL